MEILALGILLAIAKILEKVLLIGLFIVILFALVVFCIIMYNKDKKRKENSYE